MRQISGKGYETCRRELDGLFAGRDGVNDFGGEIGETHEHRQIIAPDAEPRRHGVDVFITARKNHMKQSRFTKEKIIRSDANLA